MRKVLFITVAILLAWSASGWSLIGLPGAAGTKMSPEFVPGQVLLKVSPGISVNKIAGAVDARVVRGIGDGSIVLLQVDRGEVAGTVRALREHREVVFAEPNWLRQPHGPIDDGYHLKWDLHNGGTLSDGSDIATADADTDWGEAYDLLGADFSGISAIAVIDTGIDASHPDLDDKIIGGYDYLDDDGNPHDTYGHGTHVAGIALAETDNATGTVGMGYGDNIAVMPLRVCDSGGCPTSAIVNAIYHAADNGADVINLSLGGRFGSASEEQAIDYAWSRGLVIAASSGNDGSGKVSYPAAFANAIAVGSTNWHDQVAPYSNKGSDLDVTAPGGDMSRYDDPGGIYSTMPTEDVYLTTTYSYDKHYDQLQGTSMAAPQVSGLAALLFAIPVADSNGDGLINDEVRSIIESTADDLGKPGWDRDFGWGRINVHNAVLAATGSESAANSSPVATFTFSCTGLSCDFDGTGSHDSDGTIVSYAWDFGDDSTGSGETVGHSYGADGTYTVVLTVTDSDDATGTDSQAIAVSEGALVDVTGIDPMTMAAGESVAMTVTGSGFASGATVTFENGSGPAPEASGISVSADGTTIEATVTAKSGGPPRNRAWDVRVANPDGSTGVLGGALTITP